jgi:hypothetical protein
MPPPSRHEIDAFQHETDVASNIEHRCRIGDIALMSNGATEPPRILATTASASAERWRS